MSNAKVSLQKLLTAISSFSPMHTRNACVAHLITTVGSFVVLLEHLFEAVAVCQLVDGLARSL